MTKQARKVQQWIAMILAVLMLATSVPMQAIALDADSAGITNADGYVEIKTVEDLYNIRNDMGGKYILMNDIDLTEATAPGGDWDFMGNGWNPIGSKDIYSNTPFIGELNGNGKKIIGLRIEVTELPSGASSEQLYVGLFASIGAEGSVYDLTLCDGFIDCRCAISNYVGSLTGYMSGVVRNIHNYNDVSLGRRGFVGGIAGNNTDGKIELCSNHGAINLTCNYNHTAYAGGIVGELIGTGEITLSYNTGSVYVENESTSYVPAAGGLAGNVNGTNSTNRCIISESYNSGEVFAYYRGTKIGTTGGVAGEARKAAITNCYNSGITNGYGVAYRGSEATLKNCYYLTESGSSSTGATSLTESQMLLQSMYVGFDFENTWVMDTQAIYPYPQLKENPQDLRILEGIAMASLPNKTVYAYGEDLDLAGCTIELKIKDGEPEYIAVTDDMVSGFEPLSPGTQIITVTYMSHTTSFTVEMNEKIYTPIYTVEDLYNIRNDMAGKYILMRDIDLTEATAPGGDWDFMGNGWNPIGSEDIYSNTPFTGELNGNGKKIIGLRIDVKKLPSGTDSTLYLGLFSSIGAEGSVYDLTLCDGSIACGAKTAYAGNLAGQMSGIVRNIYNYNDINLTVGGRIGGIAGSGSGKMELCKNHGDITMTASDSSSGGGIIGRLSGTGQIDRCYNAGNIYIKSSVFAYTGGLVGQAYGTSSSARCTITESYNSGEVFGSPSNDVGGVVGAITYVTITDCYNGGNTNNYGIARINAGTLTNCYYLTGAGSSSTGATALTEAQMKLKTMFSGFDFDNVWTLDEFANYPYPQLRDNIQDLRERAEIVRIITLPAKRQYMTGDALDLSDGLVEVVYASGRKEVIGLDKAEISGYDPESTGSQTITVTVAGVSDTFEITVIQRPEVASVTIQNQPDQKEFVIGTAFDFTGAQALVLYEGGITEVVDITVEMTTGGNINRIGKQTITVTFGNKSASFEVEVIGVSITEIVLTSYPEKLTYLEGQPLELSGMVVTARMNNGTESPIGSGYTVDGYASTPGTHKVTVSYLGFEASFEVQVLARSLVSLTLESLPTKVTYYAGEKFDPAGMVIRATYDNGDVEVAENYTVSGFDDEPGLKNVTISLDGQSVSFPVRIIARVITKVEITAKPYKLTYIQEEPFDPAGLVVTATYNDGSKEEVTDYQLVGYSSTPGTQTISVMYQGFVNTFEVVVEPRVLVDLVLTYPKKLTYFIGEEFDETGLTVTACYNNGQRIPVYNYALSGFDSKTEGTKTILVAYEGMERSFSVVVSKKADIETGGSVTVGTVEARPGDTVQVPVTVSGNVGIAGFRHTVTFDPAALKFVGVTAQGAFAEGQVVLNEEKLSQGEVDVVWFGTKDIAGSGIVYYLEFEVLETDAEKTSEIAISFNNTDHGNVAGENVIFEAVNGGVDILLWWPGDLNGDRLCTMADLIILAQYVAGQNIVFTEKQLLAADVNGDHVIDIHDVILLQQWLLEEDF